MVLHPVVTDKKSINAVVSTTGSLRRIAGRDGKFSGNAAVNFTLAQAFGISKAVKVVPALVQIPNVFPNVREDAFITLYNEFLQTVVANFILPAGWYSTQELLTFFEANGFLNSDTTSILSIDPVTGKFLFAPDIGDGFYTLTMPESLFDMMGYRSFAEDQGNIPGSSGDWVWSVEAVDPDIPNFSGVNTVHVLANNFGDLNCCSNVGSSETDHPPIIFSVSMGSTPYGNLATSRATTLHVDDIDFRNVSDISDFDMFLTDENMKQLFVPTNYHVQIVFKVFHDDESRG